MKLPGCLGTLNAEQHSYLISLLSLGKPDGEITAAIIENGWLPDVKKQTILKNVNRWRRGQGQQALITQVKDALVAPSGKMKRQIDVLEELTHIVIKQKERIKKMALKEDPTPMLLQTVSDEMKTLVQMLEKLGKFQLDTGILRKVRVGEVEGDYVDVEDVDEEQKEVFTEEDKRLLAIVEREVLGITAQ